MADLHIDDFYKDAARILVQLYQAFPRKVAVYVEDISGPDEPDEYGLHSTRYLACLGTMLWLGEQGYLQYESTIRQEAIDQAVLSHRGFTLLTAPGSQPDTQSQSNIDALRGALKSRSSDRLMAVMQELMGRAHHFQ